MSRSDFSRRRGMPARRKISSDTRRGASARMGGLESCQPSAPWRRHEMRTHAGSAVVLSWPHQPAKRGNAVRAWRSCTKQPRDGAWAAVEVLVAAPDGEIAAPLSCRLQREVAHGMREIEADDAAHAAARAAVMARKIERLAGAVLDAGEHHQRDARAVFGRARVRWPPSEVVPFGSSLSKFDQRSAGIETVEADLRFHRVAIGGKAPASRSGWRAAPASGDRSSPSSGAGSRPAVFIATTSAGWAPTTVARSSRTNSW